MNALLTLEQVSKGFHGLPVLDQISCTVQRGEILSLVGPSGCGKSTLLRLMAGIEAPNAGRITRRFKRAGFVFQEPRLLPWRSAQENVELVLLDELPDREARAERAKELLRRVDLAGFEGYSPAQLSGGMRQRVAIARALAVEPDFLLLDEPFASLDFSLRLQMIAFLRTLLAGSDGAFTAIYVTHDVREALMLGHRLCLLSPRPARIRRLFDLGGGPSDDWRLDDRLRQIEEQVIEALLDG